MHSVWFLVASLFKDLRHVRCIYLASAKREASDNKFSFQESAQPLQSLDVFID